MTRSHAEDIFDSADLEDLNIDNLRELQERAKLVSKGIALLNLPLLPSREELCEAQKNYTFKGCKKDAVRSDCEKPFFERIDTSNFRVRVVLLQGDKLQNKLPVAYFSKKLNESQRKYSTVEKETLALLLSLRHFEVYATSGVAPLKVFSDHNPIRFLQRFGNKNRRLANWSLILQEYNFLVEHIKGRENVIADTLSRNFLD